MELEDLSDKTEDEEFHTPGENTPTGSNELLIKNVTPGAGSLGSREETKQEEKP
jgi:hypothetical protein